MDKNSKYGTPWADDELDLIVADYFVMLHAELRSDKYVKARHSAALMALIGRSHRSVEFKHQNISAVLEVLGLPWITGYVPKNNYQNAIFDAIDRYLSRDETVLNLPPASTGIAIPSAVFVDAPFRVCKEEASPVRLQRLLRKFDPVERDHKNRSLGKAGEAFVLGLERKMLLEQHLPDLAERIRWVAQEDGDGAGYDIRSFDPKGRERLIEVKTTNGAARTPFFLTRNEREVAAERPEDWCIYRVHMFIKSPRVFKIVFPIEAAVNLRPDTWRASFT